MIMDMNLFRALFLLTLLIFAAPVSAQLDTSFLGAQTSLTISPEFPHPGEKTTISFTNYGSSLYNAEIIWRLNDEVVANATNQREVEFIAGEVGDTDIVTVSIIRNSGALQSYSVEIQPTYVDIILEPQTRTPDFYEGRALPSIGSVINATVLVYDGTLRKGDYVYTWRLNNKVLENGPIRGTNQVSFDTPRGSKATLHVEVAGLDGNILGRRAIYFKSVYPELAFYESNALHGQSHTAITDSLVLIGTAATIVAEPYNLDIRTYNNPDINEWEINNTIQSNNNSNPYLITIQKVSEGGTSKVSFHVRSTSELLQGVEDDIRIVF